MWFTGVNARVDMSTMDRHKEMWKNVGVNIAAKQKKLNQQDTCQVTSVTCLCGKFSCLFQETNEHVRILKKSPKSLILGPFGGKKEFSWRKGLFQFLNISLIYHRAKNQKETNAISLEKCQTDKRTDKQTDKLWFVEQESKENVKQKYSWKC